MLLREAAGGFLRTPGPESGRQDLNLRPPGPQPGALPDCATPRGSVPVYALSVRNACEHVFVMKPGFETRRCGDCGVRKPAHEFSWRRRKRNQRDNLCRPCRAAYHQRHYATNRQRYIDQARERKQALALSRTAYLLAFFGDHPCGDCGETDAVVLEFDHVRDKLFDIGSALPYRNWQSILDEMQKCEVVCANCHRRGTAHRRGSLRVQLQQVTEKRA